MENLRNVRKSAGLTQKKLAELARVSMPKISAYENGKTSPSCKTLLKLAQALGCSVDDLVKKDA